MRPPSAERDPEELGRALVRIDRVSKAGLTRWIGGLDQVFAGASGPGVAGALGKNGIDEELLTAALLVKRAAGQINVIVHVVGILVGLPKILEPGEVVESLSLGAGNTGQAHDLETDRRIAEFTFIDWRGGAESIRQNKLFGDVVALVSAQTNKRRVLYVNGKDIPLRFLQNRRALSSVLKDAPLDNLAWLWDQPGVPGEKVLTALTSSIAAEPAGTIIPALDRLSGTRRKRWRIGMSLVERAGIEPAGDRRPWLEAAKQSRPPSKTNERKAHDEYRTALDRAVEGDSGVDDVIGELRERLG